MATKQKNWYYVLVMSNDGPVFVTKIEYATKYAHWDKTEKPLAMDKSRAEDLTLGLNLNFHTAFMVCSKFELDTQPYRYDAYHIEWKENEKEEQDNDESK